MGLTTYQHKRNFAKTSEPRGKTAAARMSRTFVVQKHDASRLHYDFRLEHKGVLLSWAVPKGPSLDPSEKRLAVQVEDHPVEYGKFEGTIPKGEYGGGTVMLWDTGQWVPLESDVEGALRKGKLTFRLQGTRLRGDWTLARMRGGREGDEEGKNWLLIKQHDDAAHVGGRTVTDTHLRSITTKRSMEEIAGAATQSATTGRKSTLARMPREKRATADKAGARKAGSPARSRSRGRAAGGGEKPSGGDAGSEVAAAAAGLRGAVKASIPGAFSPQLCVLSSGVPQGEGWIHEIKFDGYRVIIRKSGDDVQVFTRTGKDWSAKFKPVVAAAKAVPAQTAILDGELVILNEAGHSSFGLLQRAIRSQKFGQLAVYLFDVPYLEGYDLSGVKLLDRKAALRALLEGMTGEAGVLRYSDHVAGSGAGIQEQMCELKLEGAISKRADSLYEQRRSPNWVKTKCGMRQEFVIVGFTPPEGSRKNFGALLLGAHDEQGRLVYTGKVGTGFDAARLRDIAAKMAKLLRRSLPLDEAPPREEVSGAVWVNPKLVAEVQFTEWTTDGRLRHPSFKGLREDKEAKHVRIEKPQPVSSKKGKGGKRRPAIALKASSPKRSTSVTRQVEAGKDGNTVAGVEISSADRVVYPDCGVTKLDVAKYYEKFAPLILSYVEGRPLSTVRCPQGRGKQCFFQKHVGEGFPKAIESVRVREKSGDGDYITIDSAEGLVSLVQFGVLEIHPWGARNDDIEHPDVLTFDLDPGEGVGFAAVREAAVGVRDILSAVKLKSFVKTSGGKGLHVCVPIRPESSWQNAKSFAKAVAEHMAEQDPKRYIATMSKAQREGKIFIDYLRNGRGATSVAPYSTRARPNAPISMPLQWQDLPTLKSADAFTLADAMKSSGRRRPDPWKGYFEVDQAIPKGL